MRSAPPGPASPSRRSRASTSTISGKDLLKVAQKWPGLLSAVTLDQSMRSADYQNATMWTVSADVTPLWNSFDIYTGHVTGPAPQAPAIAFIDSGSIRRQDRLRVARRRERQLLLALQGHRAGNDLEGHGTMVAGLRRVQNPDYPASRRTRRSSTSASANANGESIESDVIAAADWVLANKDTYGIKVVNISMAGSSPTSFQFDPLDQAVERLWFSGVTVVVAAGNSGDGAPVDMSAAPGNDPFVITVGALDQNQTSDLSDDTVTPGRRSASRPTASRSPTSRLRVAT